MRSELRVSPHTLLAGVKCVEIWYDNRIIGVIYPADFGGVRIISKHFDNRQSPQAHLDPQEPPVFEVRIVPPFLPTVPPSA
ncbi:MAG: hypothetical protein KBH81_08695 [Phycisphaerae bacterium]|nr:hypothetical protein [Phycisphaerae bacterium]HPC22880.1 hypothetical protein [Phycisphaerae bacterium]HRT41967.1 hypothetical protein [Phycisphaerae bacterium]